MTLVQRAHRRDQSDGSIRALMRSDRVAAGINVRQDVHYRLFIVLHETWDFVTITVRPGLNTAKSGRVGRFRRANVAGLCVSINQEVSGVPEADRGPSQEEIALVTRAQGGDGDAFSKLVRLYQRRAVAVAYRLLGSSDDAQDVSQDAFVRAYRNLGQLEDPARFGGWLMRTVCNLSLNYRRSRTLRLATSLDESVTTSDGWRDPATGGRVAVTSGSEVGSSSVELQGAIGAAIEQLPDKQRLALILFSVEGMAQKQVAEVLGCSVELVKWNVFQARKTLKELLAGYL